MDQNKRVTRSRTISTGSNSSIASNSSTNSVKRRLDPKELNSTIIHQEKFQKMAEKVDLTTLNEKLNILIKKLDSSDEKINLMQMTLNKLVNQVEIVEHRTTKLEKNVDIIFEQLNEFKGSQYHLHAEINTLQQANLKSSISIRGLPGNLPRDEAMKVIANLGAILGIPLTLADFSSQPYIVYHRDQKECHVVGTFNDQPHIPFSFALHNIFRNWHQKYLLKTVRMHEWKHHKHKRKLKKKKTSIAHRNNKIFFISFLLILI